VINHVLGFDSIYVSTTDDFEVAKRKANQELSAHPGLGVTYVYLINRPPNAFSVPYPSIGLDGFSWEREVLVPYYPSAGGLSPLFDPLNGMRVFRPC